MNNSMLSNGTLIHELIAASLALIISVVWPMGSACAGDAVPDLRGTWNGSELGVMLGDEKANLTVEADTHPRVQDLPIELIIDFQDGRALAGTKRHKFGTDRFVAVIRRDNRTIHGTDAEGDMDLIILPNGELDSCYTEHDPHRALASCGSFHRVK